MQTFISGSNERFDSAAKLFQNRRYWDFIANSIYHNNEALVVQKGGVNQSIGGNTTDRALLSYILQYPTNFYDLTVVSKMPFSSVAKFSSTQVKGRYNLTFIKGAPEKILPYCSTYYDKKSSNTKLYKAKRTLKHN